MEPILCQNEGIDIRLASFESPTGSESRVVFALAAYTDTDRRVLAELPVDVEKAKTHYQPGRGHDLDYDPGNANTAATCLGSA